MDPAEVRRKNFIAKDAFPHTTASGATYDSGDYEGALDLALRSVGYDELRAEQQRRRDDGDATRARDRHQLVRRDHEPARARTEFGEVEITADGGAIVRTGSFSHGQGHETTFAMIAAERLGLPIEKVTVVKGDTDEVAQGHRHVRLEVDADRRRGRQARRRRGRRAARRSSSADYLEASVDDIVLDHGLGRFHVVGTPEPALSWAELAERAAGRRPARRAEGRSTTSRRRRRSRSARTSPSSRSTSRPGRSSCVRLVAVDDAGTLINPLIAEGQVHGGVATGVAQALYEEFVYDEDGNPLDGHLRRLRLPLVRRPAVVGGDRDGDADPVNALGAKGIGESGTIGATPAVQNAVVDALAPFGVRHVDMPCNGENVWRALQEAKA